MFRFLGAIFIIGGAAAGGIIISANVKQSIKLHYDWLQILQLFHSEIEFKLTSMSDLCIQVMECSSPVFKNIFNSMYVSLVDAPGKSIGVQMHHAIDAYGGSLPKELKKIMTELFDVLGHQDVYAQLRAIDYAKYRTNIVLNSLEKDKTEKSHSYRVIGVCAGVAIAIVLL